MWAHFRSLDKFIYHEMFYILLANNVVPDQIAPKEAVWSESALKGIAVRMIRKKDY